MTSFSGRQQNLTYQGLLNVDNGTTGVDATLRQVQSGAGVNIPMQVSSSAINFTGTFEVNGSTITFPTSGGTLIANFSRKISLFTSSGTFTPQTTTIEADFIVIGGGASGGGTTGSSSSGNSSAAGGGGAGGYAWSHITIAQLGASAAITIGAGGAATTTGANNGNNGGTTSVVLNGTGAITITATGGTGGTAGTNNVAGIAGGASGTTTNSDLPYITGKGKAGLVYVSGNLSVGGEGGSVSLYGIGGQTACAVNSANNGVSGSGFGAGGSGGCSAQSSTSTSGGAGLAGAVIVIEYIFT